MAHTRAGRGCAARANDRVATGSTALADRSGRTTRSCRRRFTVLKWPARDPERPRAPSWGASSIAVLDPCRRGVPRLRCSRPAAVAQLRGPAGARRAAGGRCGCRHLRRHDWPGDAAASRALAASTEVRRETLRGRRQSPREFTDRQQIANRGLTVAADAVLSGTERRCKMMRRKGCPRCRGDLHVVRDVGESYFSCVQCGFVSYEALAPPVAVAANS